MHHDVIAENLRARYKTIAARYRKDDEQDATGTDHKRHYEILGILSRSFNRPITVLDMGCGTGRYFHCLRNVQKLVGLDVCQEMLDEARNPVKAEELSIQDLELVNGSIFTASFAPTSFDLIYSIGVFGNGCGLTKELLKNVYRWLAPGGSFLFDAIDSSGLPRLLRVRKKLRTNVYRLFQKRLPFLIKADHWPPLYIYSRSEIIALMESTGFFPLAVYSQECQLPLGRGAKLQCLGAKGPERGRAARLSLQKPALLALSSFETVTSYYQGGIL